LVANSASSLFLYHANLRVSASPFTQPVFLPGAKLDEMFYSTSFDSPLNWNLLNVTTVTGMFQNTPLNKSINFSNTQGLVQCGLMFYYTPNFNQPFTMDIPNVVRADSMFGYATSLNQPVTLTNSQKVTNTYGMFAHASSFNQPLTLDTRAVTYMQLMFNGAVKFNQPLTFDTGRVTDMQFMFFGASSFNQTLNFSSTANVTTMSTMFQDAPLFEQDLASWNTSSVTACSSFCPRCGLPAFPLCGDNPCATSIYTNERNMSVCYSLAPTSTPTSPTTGAPSTLYPTSTPTSTPTSSQPTSLAPTLAPDCPHARSLLGCPFARSLRGPLDGGVLCGKALSEGWASWAHRRSGCCPRVRVNSLFCVGPMTLSLNVTFLNFCFNYVWKIFWTFVFVCFFFSRKATS